MTVLMGLTYRYYFHRRGNRSILPGNGIPKVCDSIHGGILDTGNIRRSWRPRSLPGTCCSRRYCIFYKCVYQFKDDPFKVYSPQVGSCPIYALPTLIRRLAVAMLNAAVFPTDG